MKFVKFVDNYADEFDVFGCAMFDDKQFREWDRAMTKASTLMKQGYEFTLYFGTNEYLLYNDSYFIGEAIEIHDVYAGNAYALQAYIVGKDNTYMGVFPDTAMLEEFIARCGGEPDDE
jgi:hypothetical protein